MPCYFLPLHYSKFKSDLIYNVCAVFHSLTFIYHAFSVHILYAAKDILISKRERRKNSKHTLFSLNECVWLGFVKSSQASFFFLITGYRV